MDHHKSAVFTQRSESPVVQQANYGGAQKTPALPPGGISPLLGGNRERLPAGAERSKKAGSRSRPHPAPATRFQCRPTLPRGSNDEDEPIRSVSIASRR